MIPPTHALIKELGQHAALEALGSFIYLKDRQGLYVFASRGYADHLGVPLEEIIGRGDGAILPGTASDERTAVDARVMDTAQTIEREDRKNDRTGGGELVYRTIKTPIVDAAGSVIGVSSVSTNITDMKRVEAELGYLNVIVEESSTIMYLALAVDGAPRVYTSANVIRFGYTVEDCKEGRFRFPDFIHQEDRAQVLEGVELMVGQGQDVLESEYRLIAADGSVHHVLDRTSAIRDETGAVTHWQGAITDVTERWEAEQAMKRSQALIAEQRESLAVARAEVSRLKVEIDLVRRKSAVAEITESDEFASLAERGAALRARNAEDS